MNQVLEAMGNTSPVAQVVYLLIGVVVGAFCVGVVLWDRWVRAQSSANLANELLRITEDEDKRLYAKVEEGLKRIEKEQQNAKEFRNLVFSETYRSTVNLPN